MNRYIDTKRLKEEIKKKIAEIESEPAPPDRETLLLQMCKINAFREVLGVMNRLQHEQPEVELKNYISNKLRELGADLINHKPYSFNRGLNVGKTNAYNDILDRLNARKEE